MNSSLEYPIILIHGWPVTDYHWRHCESQLRDAGITSHKWSPPGLGSAGEYTTDYRKKSLALSLANWLDDHQISQAMVIGHDWGGTIALMLGAQRADLVRAVVVEEEVLPGIDVLGFEAEVSTYPSWHGPFNRSIGLAESMVPDREDAYYGTFLGESAGPIGLASDALKHYLNAYRSPATLNSGLAYYRTRQDDVSDVTALFMEPLTIPILAVGGLYGMGAAVAAGLRPVAANVEEIVLRSSGHYPAEQEPLEFAQAVIRFHHST